MSNPPRRFRLFPQTLGAVIHQVTAPIMDKRHKILALLLRDWQEIVGPEMAREFVPLRLNFPHHDPNGGTLILQVPAHRAPEIPYLSPQLLEKFASYIGYRAISRITVEIKG